jgi:uncharacterized protein (TIGR00266 family)
METNTKGGVGKAFGRLLSGESFFMNTYSCEDGQGMISFPSEFPGKIVPIQLDGTKTIIAQKDAFMVAQETVNLDIKFNKKLGAGFFGGEGFILQKISGTGYVFLEICGDLIEINLEEGQTLKIDPGHIAYFEDTVTYDIAAVKGVKNMLFGGEGLFLATLSGPGKICLQTMPIAKLAYKISSTLGRKH